MAHRFKIMDDTGTLTTYTDYDLIPLSTLKHVIAFEPDLGTEVASNEILLEIDTLDSGETDIDMDSGSRTDITAGENIDLNAPSGEIDADALIINLN